MQTTKTPQAPLPLPTPASTAAKQYSSVAQTYDILSDAWLCLILQECFLGTNRFEQFYSRLGLPRPTLALRLKKMQDTGLLLKRAYQESPLRYEYLLTDKGQALYPTVLAIHSFGIRWLTKPDSPTLSLQHLTCGHFCQPVVLCSECRTPIYAQHVRYRPNADLPTSALVPAPARRSRRSSDPTIYGRVRPSPFARTLGIIGDRWSFLVIRELFYGVRRYDEFLQALNVATNILADRLQHLQDHQIIKRLLYQRNPPRHEYKLTPKGKDLYGSMLAMMHWADHWIHEKKAPLLLHHLECGNDFHAIVACNKCQETLTSDNTLFSTLPALNNS